MGGASWPRLHRPAPCIALMLVLLLMQQDGEGGGSDWSHLPAEIVHCLAVTMAGSDSSLEYAEAMTLLRLCCKDWWRALPIGETSWG